MLVLALEVHPDPRLESHQKLLNIRCLVIDKKDEIDNYINFAKMA